MVQQSFDRTQDANLIFTAGATVTASGAIGSVVDLGGAGGHSQFDIVFDVTAVDVASTDEVYTVLVQVGDGADFTTATNVIPVAAIRFGVAAKLGANATDNVTTGRYLLAAHNFAYSTAGDAGTGTYFRYVRLVLDATGSTTPSITLSAWASKRQ